jgi:hypothetical protein
VADPLRDTALAAECQQLTAYLLGVSADPHVTAAYVRAHRYPGLEPGTRHDERDRALMRLAGLGTSGMRAADAYSALLAKDSLLRRKLAVLVAILESRGDSAARLDTATGTSLPVWGVMVAFQAAACAVRIAAVVCALPLLRLSVRADRRQEA